MVGADRVDGLAQLARENNEGTAEPSSVSISDGAAEGQTVTEDNLRKRGGTIEDQDPRARLPAVCGGHDEVVGDFWSRGGEPPLRIGLAPVDRRPIPREHGYDCLRDGASRWIDHLTMDNSRLRSGARYARAVGLLRVLFHPQHRDADQRGAQRCPSGSPEHRSHRIEARQVATSHRDHRTSGDSGRSCARRRRPVLRRHPVQRGDVPTDRSKTFSPLAGAVSVAGTARMTSVGIAP